MWQLKIVLPHSLIPEIEKQMEESPLTLSIFEKEEQKKIWEIDALYKECPSQESLKFLNQTKEGTPLSWSLKPLPDQGWLKENRKSFPTIEVGKFLIYGSHMADMVGKLPQDKLCLQLNASTAFGSGSHETTQGCLLALQEVCTGSGLKIL